MAVDANLKALAEQSAAQDGGYLLMAKEKAKSRMKDDPSRANIEAFNKATRALEDHLYKSDAGSSIDQISKNVDSALKRLKERGWKISRSKIFADASSGLLKRQSDGSILAADLDRYVVEARLRLSSDAPNADSEMARLKIQQTKAEIREREARADMAEIERNKKLEQLISREDADMEMALAVTILKSSLRNFFGTTLPEIVHIANGDPKQQDALMDFLSGAMNDFFNGFARKREFHVQESDDDPSNAG